MSAFAISELVGDDGDPDAAVDAPAAMATPSVAAAPLPPAPVEVAPPPPPVLQQNPSQSHLQASNAPQLQPQQPRSAQSVSQNSHGGSQNALAKQQPSAQRTFMPQPSSQSSSSAHPQQFLHGQQNHNHHRNQRTHHHPHHYNSRHSDSSRSPHVVAADLPAGRALISSDMPNQPSITGRSPARMTFPPADGSSQHPHHHQHRNHHSMPPPPHNLSVRPSMTNLSDAQTNPATPIGITPTTLTPTQQQASQQRFRRATLSNAKPPLPNAAPAALGSAFTKPDSENRERDELIAKTFVRKLMYVISSYGKEDDFKSITNRGQKRPSSTDLASSVSKPSKQSSQIQLNQRDVLFSNAHPVMPSQWQPTLKLPPEHGSATVTLTTLEILPLRAGPTFVLESQYTIEKTLPRSYFLILQQYNIGHTFVFSWPEPDHVFFQEIAGMRKSTYVVVKELNTNERWEIHLKPSKERTNIFGYLYKPDDINRIIQERAEALLRSRRLPLVLDLDDTLVRAVGNAPGRYVSETDIGPVMHRVKELRDGRKVVLTERVHEFLDWAQKYFEISVCSLGDQPYVDMIVSVLDPGRNTIRGISYSARGEYLYIQQQSNQQGSGNGNASANANNGAAGNGTNANGNNNNVISGRIRPPKDLLSLFPFCAVRDANAPQIDPLILDDNVNMWPQDQQDNIIVVRENSQSSVWSVSLFPVVQQVLAYIHESYFRQLDAWMQEKPPRGPPPSTLSCYKDYLRRELSVKIAQSVPQQ